MTVSYDAATRTATAATTAGLLAQTSYTVTVSAAIRDLAGNPLAADVTSTFTTAAAAPPADEGPGGPILVIASTSNPFGRYYAEILRAEGLNEFTVTDISLVTPAMLTAHDVAILGEMPLTSSQVAMLAGWVSSGGNLVAMRPDKQLAGLLGLSDQAATLGNAYLQVNTTAAPGAGIVADTIQFHGAADRYVAAGATTIATLFSDATTATGSPAVTIVSVGEQGGQAAAFTFDLARSIVYTRQGNPAWSGQERDGDCADPLRRSVLRRGRRGSAGGLDRSHQGRDSAGRRAAAAPRQSRAPSQSRAQAAAAVLVPAARGEGGARDDGRRSRQWRDGGTVQPVQRR